MHPHLAVAFYRPRYGNFQHWALHLHTPAEDLVFEVDGEHPAFQKATSHGRPCHADGFIESLFVCEIGEPDIPTVKALIAQAIVDNETLEWDCQEYVLDILEACENEGILDDTNEDYLEVKQMLKDRRGPML